MTSDAAEFAEFVAEHGDGLLRFARSLTGDRHRAEDLVQSALARTYARWPSVRRRDPLAYVRRAVVNGRISGWRRRSSTDVLGAVPDLPAPDRPDDDVVERLRMRAALAALPTRQRAVLVLRYLLDVPDGEIAAALGTSEATVRSQAHRGLAKLRARLGEAAAPAGTAVSPAGRAAANPSGRPSVGLGGR
ncbi:SigE family RNA polymerase sigma factor [Frankia sp. AgB1.9]|uniref:SigE family RNA polymerase sigma factor n=1 Tax=unclassified Frankia TaxID=2632575 RepID=UPI001933EBA1|nr:MULTISPECIES: SigE family RNA polymerase sigma factor [unclassified Frankia]MBL7492112.1 SigE family RNA polymerase sigma factor [Frankia sp. AgW1.1]MBL7551729.1 SigE family RNA polymerase sigma factor [Frankia sp. AgB1.9]MBL7623535.1 SigE family RNA polymerase sigma factor [Frankia sp. AgB1.8]